jgi:ribosomal protein L24
MNEPFVIGDTVRVIKGVFEGKTGEVARVNFDTNEVNVYLLSSDSTRSGRLPVTMNARWVERA